MVKMRDLWSAEGDRAINAPQPVRVSKGWDVAPEVLPAKPLAPRKRKYIHVKPNRREAVPLPHPGQSYNPCDDDHQDALRITVRQLERKKAEHEKFVAKMTRGCGKPIKGNSSTVDKTLVEEQRSGQASGKGDVVPQAENVKQASNEPGKKNSKKKKKKKVSKASLQAAKKALPHRRHPKRDVVVREVDNFHELAKAHAKKEKIRAAARERRRSIKRDGLKVKTFGRHHYSPVALDVAPSQQLVGSLRHLNGGSVHFALDRMKSFEERNLVPARVPRACNRKKVLKPKGDVRLKRETFGVVPDTTF
ncbi:putative Nop53 (60S ribosomal biogenesis) [Trypanosoma vivax]|uniref:Ribosome biogenesis protein NOP53 n=1 Tax=Trypanosoma vivax (strain Y486) TaxID=1055687 RepID=G0U3I4_TRYVY|nr:hypothetical protein TRVL_00375 [Trypanosoma vivax]KAH8614146.1 putative Nop53 (60S ribosomal biogenesis) [Trypanosoma vivax]CCC50841.1 conserved hypothetical protein [Trypanosoma vivax Y486]